MTVYYLGHPCGAVKIGYAGYALKRQGQLQRDYGVPLTMLAYEPGMADVERLRHREYDADRLNRHQEWFRPSRALRRHIEDLRRATPMPRREVSLRHWPSPPDVHRIEHVSHPMWKVAAVRA